MCQKRTQGPEGGGPRARDRMSTMLHRARLTGRLNTFSAHVRARASNFTSLSLRSVVVLYIYASARKLFTIIRPISPDLLRPNPPDSLRMQFAREIRRCEASGDDKVKMPQRG